MCPGGSLVALALPSQGRVANRPGEGGLSQHLKRRWYYTSQHPRQQAVERTPQYSRRGCYAPRVKAGACIYHAETYHCWPALTRSGWLRVTAYPSAREVAYPSASRRPSG